MDKTSGFFLIIILAMVMFWVAFNPNLTDILAVKKNDSNSETNEISVIEKGATITGVPPKDGSNLSSGTKTGQPMPVRYWFKVPGK